MYWSSSSGRIELKITKRQAAACAHPGPCDQDVLDLLYQPAIRRQLHKVPSEVLVAELEEYGAWNEVELQDRYANLQRLLWLACGDIHEEARA